MTQRLRVLSLNIWNKQGPYAERLPLLRALLAECNADIVGLQEVLRLEGEAGGNQAAELADGFGYHTAYGGAWLVGGGLHFGNAVLSRFPFSHSEHWPLPGPSNEERRGLLHTMIDLPEGKLPFFVTHLDWQFHLSALRQQQTFFIAETVARLAPVASELLPPIVVGDFNADPDADEIRFMSGLRAAGGHSVYFADCFRVAGSGDGATFAKRNGFAAELREPDRRIDYVFVRGPDKKKRGVPVSCRVVGDQPHGDVFPSDHFGVLAEIDL